jgi:hypothetical protein
MVNGGVSGTDRRIAELVSRKECRMTASEIGIIFVALIALVIVGNIECILHTQYGGSMKRGVKVWSEILPADMKRFLHCLSGNIFDGVTGTFIRKENNVVLVQHHPTKKWWRKRGVLWYVAYIDLRVSEPKIQYRVAISPLPFFVLWMSVAVWASFHDVTALLLVALGVLGLYAAHTSERKGILRFIREKMQISYIS